MIKWVAEVRWKYSFFNLKWKTLLVLVDKTTHKTSKVKDKIKERETVLLVIPSGLTRRLQPLSININKMF